MGFGDKRDGPFLYVNLGSRKSVKDKDLRTRYRCALLDNHKVGCWETLGKDERD